MSINDVQGGGGGTGFLSTLDLLADPVRLKALYKEYEEKTAAYQEILSQVGVGIDVIQLREALRKELEGVPGIKAQAQEEANKLLDDARATVNSGKDTARATVAAAQAEAADLVAQAQRTSDDAVAKFNAVEELRFNLHRRQEELNAHWAQLEIDQAALKEAQAQVEADRNKLSESLAKAQALLQ
jgi:chromosome segregation ATPase